MIISSPEMGGMCLCEPLIKSFKTQQQQAKKKTKKKDKKGHGRKEERPRDGRALPLRTLINIRKSEFEFRKRVEVKGY